MSSSGRYPLEDDLDHPLENGQSKISWEEAVLWLKSQPDQNQLVKACFFDDPLKTSAERYYASTEWRAVRKLIGKPTGRALDLGSGRGISAYALARDGWQTTALEPNPSSEVGAGAIRRLVSETGIDIRIVEDWGEELPFESDSFDLVLGRQVLHHARDLGQLCREAARVLKPNGTFIAVREHVLSKSSDLKLFLDRHPLHRLYGGENAFELREYVAAITNAGIRLTQTMNPLESDINLYPDSRSELKARIARRIRLPYPGLIHDRLLGWAGRAMRGPGRLYSLVGIKT